MLVLGLVFVSRFLGGPSLSDTEVVEYSDDTLERLAGRAVAALLAGRLRLSLGLSRPIGFGLVIGLFDMFSEGVDVDNVAASDALDPLRDDDRPFEEVIA